MEEIKTHLGFIHKFINSQNKSSEENSKRSTLVLFHGTGGNEDDLVSIGHELSPTSALLSPRGKVLEHGLYPRYFKRRSEGVFDIEDLKFRTKELVEFIECASKTYGFDLQNIFAVGYSNGANMASSILLLYPEILSGVILFRPMVPLVPDKMPDLRGKNVFVSAGIRDKIVQRQQTQDLITLLSSSGANVHALWQDSGHDLIVNEIELAKRWLSDLMVNGKN